MPAINKTPAPKESPASPAPVVNRAILAPRGPADALRVAALPSPATQSRPKEETRHG